MGPSLPTAPGVFSLGSSLLTSASTLPSESHLLTFEHISQYSERDGLHHLRAYSQMPKAQAVFQLIEKTGCHVFNHVKFGNFFHSESEPKDVSRLSISFDFKFSDDEVFPLFSHRKTGRNSECRHHGLNPLNWIRISSILRSILRKVLMRSTSVSQFIISILQIKRSITYCKSNTRLGTQMHPFDLSQFTDHCRLVGISQMKGFCQEINSYNTPQCRYKMGEKL